MITATVFVAAALGVAACGDDDDDESAGNGNGGGQAAQSNEPLVIANLEGPAADGGPDFTTGMKVAEKQINDAGGVNGRMIQVKTFKKGLTPQEAVQAYREAASDDSVQIAWLGGGGGNSVKPQSDRVGLPFFSANGRTDFYEPPAPYAFSLSLGGEYATSALNYTIKQNPDVKRIGVLHFETDFSNGLTPALKERCEELGCEIVAEETGAIDASVDGLIPQLTNLRNANADAYYIECLNPNAHRAAVQLGMDDKPRMCEQWQAVPGIATAAGEAAADEVVFGGHKCVGFEEVAEDDPTRAWCSEYVDAWREMFPDQFETFSNYSVYGHDAVTIFADAAKRLMDDGAEVTRDSLREQLEQYDEEVGLRTSHGIVTSGPDDHLLTGTWKEGYVNYVSTFEGDELAYKLAPNADPTGAEP